MSGGVSELVQPKVESDPATTTMDFEHYEEFYGTPGSHHHHHHQEQQVDHEGGHPQQLYPDHQQQQQYYDGAYYGYEQQQQQTPQVSRKNTLGSLLEQGILLLFSPSPDSQVVAN